MFNAQAVCMKVTLSIVTLSIMVEYCYALSFMLTVIYAVIYADCHLC
jgi:hypothetical protein